MIILFKMKIMENKGRIIQKMGESTVSTYFTTIDVNQVKEDAVISDKIFNLSVYNCSNYLINIFKVYNEKIAQIGCPEIKLQKMLLILQICLYKTLHKNIDELNKVEAVPCGFKIHDFSYVGNVTSTDDYSNKMIDLTDERYSMFDGMKFSFNKLFNNDLLNKDAKKLLILLFKHFGDYDPYVLGQFLNGLKNNNISNKILTLSIDDFNQLICDNYNNLDTKIKSFVDEAGEILLNG